jgi:hypothetical protein
MTNYVNNYLFADPSKVEGVGRLFDLGGTLQQYNASRTEQEADFKALLNDWLAIGNDIKHSIITHDRS